MGRQETRVLGQHRQEIADLLVTAETGEQGDGGVDHAHSLGDHDRAAAKARQPVPLPGMVALDAVGLFFADEQPPRWDQLGIGLPAIGTIKARVPAAQAREEPLEGGAIATAAFPVNQSARSTIPSLPHPELVGLFLR